MASKLTDYIRGFFKCFEKHGRNDNSFSYENNDCFQYFFKVLEKSDDILGTYYMVPAFLYDELKYCKNTNIPIQVRNKGVSELSETTFLSTLGKDNYYYRNYHLQKLYTKSGEVYYGTNGIILDSEFRILIMVVLKVINHNIVDVLCYINPRVYDNEKGTAEKIIIKKMMPFICLNSVSVYDKDRHIGPITAIFNDVTNQYIRIPVVPDEDFCDEKANNLLAAYKDTVLNYLEDCF
jgi:hypothetical protein